MSSASFSFPRTLKEEEENTIKCFFSAFKNFSSSDSPHISGAWKDVARKPLFSLANHDYPTLKKHQQELSESLGYYLNELQKVNVFQFNFQSQKKQQLIRKKLGYIYYLLNLQYQLDLTENNSDFLIRDQENMELCRDKIMQIDFILAGKTLTAHHIKKQAESNFYLKYLGWTLIVPWIKQRIEELLTNPPEAIKAWLTEINGRRLYWVWGGGLISAVLDMLPLNFYHQSEAQQYLSYPNLVNGYMSWILYFTRLGINLTWVLKPMISYLGMSEQDQERQQAWQNQLLTRLDERKFLILNDLIWGGVNLLCFYWLNNAHGAMMNYGGNIATIGLLAADLLLNTWRFWEEINKRNREIQAFKAEISLLEAQGAEAKAELKALKKREAAAALVWKYKEISLLNDWFYAFNLLIAFSVVSAFLFPPAALGPGVFLILGTVGATLCFGATLVNTLINAYIEVAKSNEKLAALEHRAEKLLKKYNAIDTSDVESTNRQKLLYLKLADTMKQLDYEKNLKIYHTLGVIRLALVDTLTPLALFGLLVFGGGTLAIPIISAKFALATFTHLLIEHYFKPKQPELTVFEDNDPQFALFSVDPSLAHFSKIGLFGQKSILKGKNDGEKKKDHGDEAGMPLLELNSQLDRALVR